ncbi:MAG: tRNA-specific adenosine deaminase [Deltaproteobacteria bacterium RIFOXYD12_FULL_57_12]|nr:MAG: tRNA-specific adenosine deaminase [Deltaproteobacteria bacterium RIFOXYD12_FULL_57_12]
MTGTHEYFMGMALDEARQSLAAGEFPVGCVIVSQTEVVARGRRVNSRGPSANELDHAEIMALRRLLQDHPAIDRQAVAVYSTMEPCLMCYATLLLNGVRSFVYGYEDVMGGGTGLALARLAPLYREMQVTMVAAVRRDESLRLFQDFFSEPANRYWQNSLLAQYTMGPHPGKELMK